MKKLISCPNAFEASLIKGRLENNGIPAVLFNEYMNDLRALPAIGVFDVFVMVPDDAYEAALQIINEPEPEGETE